MQILTLREVASELRLSKETTAKLLRQGRLPGIRVGERWRVLPEALNNFLWTGGNSGGSSGTAAAGGTETAA
jgi:excisionase family DNA binding protein